MICAFCQTPFFHTEFSGQAEPCDCGQNCDQEHADELNPDEYAACVERAKEVRQS